MEAGKLVNERGKKNALPGSAVKGEAKKICEFKEIPTPLLHLD